jgi:hypothetical protein
MDRDGVRVHDLEVSSQFQDSPADFPSLGVMLAADSMV